MAASRLLSEKAREEKKKLLCEAGWKVARSDSEEREKAREGRFYNAVAVEVHWACASGFTEDMPSS
jgi:hypothetical protein